MQNFKLPEPGEYKFNWNEYCWDTGETLELIGTLLIEETDTFTGDNPEFAWSWSFLTLDESGLARGDSLREFTRSLSDMYLMSIDVDTFCSKMHEFLGTAEYAERLLEHYEKVDTEATIERQLKGESAAKQKEIEIAVLNQAKQ